jgi:LmbE family N-acetylglucosaminyl deacetylase
MQIVVLGGHPDDPESGCGGTMARHAQAGDDVLAVYLTRGGQGVPGHDPQGVERTRTREAQTACRILNVEPLFFDFPDGGSEVSPATLDAVRTLLVERSPDLLLAHWPLDTHPDHQAVGVLALRAWLSANSRDAICSFPLYFYEVMTEQQTLHFAPNLYTDITETAPIKRQAVMAHASQHPEHWYPHHERTDSFRGAEAGVDRAEAFIVARYQMAR